MKSCDMLPCLLISICFSFDSNKFQIYGVFLDFKAVFSSLLLPLKQLSYLHLRIVLFFTNKEFSRKQCYQ